MAPGQMGSFGSQAANTHLDKAQFSLGPLHLQTHLVVISPVPRYVTGNDILDVKSPLLYLLGLGNKSYHLSQGQMEAL